MELKWHYVQPKNENIKFDSEKNVLNENGEISAAVHQYDRKTYIIKIVKNKFNLENVNIINISKIINKLYLGFRMSYIIILINFLFLLLFTSIFMIKIIKNFIIVLYILLK